MRLDAHHIVMRPYEERDRSALIHILGDADVMNLALEERALSVDEAGRYVDEHFGSRDRLGFHTVALKATDEAIGLSGFRACRYLEADDVELGWVLGRDHHGRGYATALGRALIAYALKSWRLPRVLGACHPLNHASAHVLRDKLGMRFERAVEPRPGFHRLVFSARPEP